MKKFDLKKTVVKARSLDYKKLARDFVYGKPAGERRLGDLYMDKTGLYKHREWRGIKDTFYYFNKVWLYNYGMMVYDVMRYGGIVTFAKGCWRYRWMGQTYLPVLHWFDRGMEGLRGEALRACPVALSGHGQRHHLPVHADVPQRPEPEQVRQGPGQARQDHGPRRNRVGRRLLPLQQGGGERSPGRWSPISSPAT